MLGQRAFGDAEFFERLDLVEEIVSIQLAAEGEVVESDGSERRVISSLSCGPTVQTKPMPLAQIMDKNQQRAPSRPKNLRFAVQDTVGF